MHGGEMLPLKTFTNFPGGFNLPQINRQSQATHGGICRLVWDRFSRRFR